MFDGGVSGLVSRFFLLLNRRDFAGLAEMLDEDVVLDLPDGKRVIGAKAWRDSLFLMLSHFDGQCCDIAIMADENTGRGAAEFTFKGRYKMTLPGFPDAADQAFRLNAGCFFEIVDGCFARTSFALAVASLISQLEAKAD